MNLPEPEVNESKVELRHRERQNTVLRPSPKVLDPVFPGAVSFIGLPNYIGQYLPLFVMLV